ncbi:hypothetical protein J5N97_026645 [Dioscorea zingiberensis]|uniref:DUF659 domain-containing protein n=1 Tax=Dioscorea zingiberensis TaxID=325984 RepID=A0A9D5H705_9LILI|nr:hypothetical protein J5N97_026645 [Dioscorea zingiberensis]
MDNIEAGDVIENHGVAMDDEKKRVKCNYCGKEVGGFNRLKHHLGALGSDVTACVSVPDDVKSSMRNGLLLKKKNRLVKQVGELFHPELPLKRKSVPVSVEPGQCLPNVDAWTKESCENASAGYLKQTPPAAAEKGKGLLEPKLEEDIDYNFTPSCVTEDVHAYVKEETKTETALYAAKCVGRFFYEVGIDPAAIKSPSFQTMVEAIGACGAGYRVPVYEELRGWILQDEIKQVQRHVEEIKSSWGQTGCSILLDGWTDQRGRSLIVFLVECPKALFSLGLLMHLLPFMMLML